MLLSLFGLLFRFVEFLEPRLPYDEKNKLSVVMEKLITAFLPERHYHNDLRFINYCIRYVSVGGWGGDRTATRTATRTARGEDHTSHIETSPD